MSFHYTSRVPIRWSDIDSFNVVNNSVYLTFAEQARYEYMTHLDLTQDGKLHCALGETACRFLKPGRLGMELEVATRVTRLGNKSLDMEHQISSDGTVLANVVATLVWVTSELKSTPIPDEARERISEFEGIAPHGGNAQ